MLEFTPFPKVPLLEFTPFPKAQLFRTTIHTHRGKKPKLSDTNDLTFNMQNVQINEGNGGGDREDDYWEIWHRGDLFAPLTTVELIKHSIPRNKVLERGWVVSGSHCICHLGLWLYSLLKGSWISKCCFAGSRKKTIHLSYSSVRHEMYNSSNEHWKYELCFRPFGLYFNPSFPCSVSREGKMILCNKCLLLLLWQCISGALCLKLSWCFKALGLC